MEQSTTPQVEIEKDLKDRMKNVRQWFHQVKTDEEKKNFIFDFISNMNKKTLKRPRIVVFFNAKEYLDRIYEEMGKDERLEEIRDQMASYHGDIDIATRKKLRADFDSGKLNILLTTNLVARGIDFYEVTAVIQCDVPIELTKRRQKDTGPILRDQIDVQTYIHRVGRAGRSNKKGVSVLISNKQGEDQIVGLARDLDVQIAPYQSFDQVKEHVDECQKHNENVNKEIAASFDKTWTQLGVSEKFQEHLIKQKFPAPRPAQVECVPRVLKFAANEDKFYQHISVFGFANGRDASHGWEPQAIIIAHTKDLCLQIGQVLSSVIPPEKKITISYLFKDSEQMNNKGNVIIGTSGSIIGHMRKFSTSKLKFLVLDEADELLDKNTKDLTEITGKIYNDVSPGFQFLLYSATFDADDFQKLQDVVDDNAFDISDITVATHFEL